MDEVEARLALIGDAVERAEVSRLAPLLESEYETSSVARRTRQLRTYLVVSAVLNLACVGFDAEFGIAQAGLVLRLAIVTPLFVACIVLLSERRAIWLQGVAFGLPIFASVFQTVVLGSMIGSLGADRYIGAAGVVSFVVNVASLVRFKHAVVLGLANVTVIAALTLAFHDRSTWGHWADLIAFAALMTFLTLRTVLLLERWHRKSFLLSLRDRLQTQILIRANRELDRLSKTDALTGLGNRRAFDEALARSVAMHEPLGLLMIDIDHFKAFNDAAGHEAGDRCLRHVALAIAGEAEGCGNLARMGGE